MEELAYRWWREPRAGDILVALVGEEVQQAVGLFVPIFSMKDSQRLN